MLGGLNFANSTRGKSGEDCCVLRCDNTRNIYGAIEAHTSTTLPITILVFVLVPLADWILVDADIASPTRVLDARQYLYP